ncbi:Uu.00g145890.m01.CDS01 [Anthostomella pinea]|uniref:Uu.00g145890.m01.CDS01 n=1 Tax=Anthostomella pinea TaxID=933095 RepID=A0AAI8VR64_9PEZI|nr:Uu.00g145890.m01.CDS01 [Anthostomella pinea]
MLQNEISMCTGEQRDNMLAELGLSSHPELLPHLTGQFREGSEEADAAGAFERQEEMLREAMLKGQVHVMPAMKKLEKAEKRTVYRTKQGRLA